ncbi:MAG TPA: MOSC domain-containing protein [Acidimicrobiales bacterium]|jgi:hypothetical protein|nr:MOSC domain-containing protein [Acidimicrobiales bacterium]
MSGTVGQVIELWRYPVKSLGGERLTEARCEKRGLTGDRWWAVRGEDGKLGSGKTFSSFRRMPGLLSMTSLVDSDGTVWVRFPDGTAGAVDDPTTWSAIGGVVGEPVTLVEEREISHFDDAPVHLVSSAALRWLERRQPGEQVDRRRFRPNIVVECAGAALAEEGWLGGRLQVGEVVVEVEHRTERCVMTTLPQADLGFAPRILRDLEEANNACFGVYATVVTAGTIRVGDAVAVL